MKENMQARLARGWRTWLKHVLVESQPTWQKFVPSFYYPYRFRGGRIYWDVTESRMMLERVFGTYEPNKYDAIAWFLRPGDVFLDVGANKGDFSLYAASLVGKDGIVIAIEPDPENCRWITRSIALNKYRQVILREVALSDQAGQATLYRGQKSGWHSLLPGLPGRDRDTVQVRTLSLDELVAEHGLNGRVTMIKVDVEGAEMMVLRGAVETLRRWPQPVVVMDVHPYLGVDPDDVCRYLEALGYRVFEESSPFNVPLRDRSQEGSQALALVARPEAPAIAEDETMRDH